MGYPNFAGRYAAMQVNTADKFELILLLYKGAIKEAKQAVVCFENGNIEERVRHINKACAIISELKAALNHQDGGEIASSLDRLYAFATHQLTLANIRRDPEPIQDVVGVMEVLLSAWEEAHAKSGSERTAAGAGARSSGDKLTLHQGASSIAVSF